jgi:hypothetical protein
MVESGCADIGDSDAARITLCKFCITTTKYMINVCLFIAAWAIFSYPAAVAITDDGANI